VQVWANAGKATWPWHWTSPLQAVENKTITANQDGESRHGKWTLTFQSLAVTLRTTSLNFNQFSRVLTLRLCVLYLSGNNLQLLPDTSPNDWFFNRSGECLLRGTHWVFILDRMRFVFKGLRSAEQLNAQ
jgi:hypothetical protein